MSNRDDELFVGLLYVAFGLTAIFVIVIASLWIALITTVVGATFGGGVSIYNYGVALKNNIKLEKPTT